jgi:hypothetical protein
MRCIGILEGLAIPPVNKAFNICPPDGVTVTQAIRVSVTFIKAHPERMHEDFRLLAVEA